MHELVKAVLVLVLSAAAAVWLLGVALQLWPNTDQLAYGNPLPYLKVEFDRPSNAVRFWVEDFGGLPYERVWLYVNGRLAASGGPGTDATAKCGDEVAAVVKYYSGVKKIEGRILCTEPMKAPGGSDVKRAIRLIQTTQAYRAMTGDMDQTGLSLRFDGSCNVDDYGGSASVTIVTLRPDVIFCVGVNCGTSYTFSWRLPHPGPYTFPRTAREIVPIHVFKVPDAPASQLLGGGRAVIDIYVEYSYNRNVNAEDLEVYVNGTRVAFCREQITVSRELRSWTVYRKPNATGVYLTRIYKPGGPVFDGNLVIYEFNGTYGFEVITNPIDGEVGPSECEPLSPTGVAVMVGGFCFTVDFGMGIYEFFNRGPLWRFLEYLYSPEGADARSALKMALDAMIDLEYNVPRIVERGNSTVYVYHTHTSRQGGSVTLCFKTLSISSLGAVYANAVLPIDITLPPPVLPQNATRTYIFGYT